MYSYSYNYKSDKPVWQSALPLALSGITMSQPVFIILYALYLITLDLVNKLYNCNCNCESTYPERVDDVRDEIINNWLGNFGSRLYLLLRGEHPLSRATRTYVKRRIMLVITVIKTVFCDSSFTFITACCWFAPYFMQHNLDFYDNHDGVWYLFNIIDYT